MANTTYTFKISSDTANASANGGVLRTELTGAAGLITASDSVNTNGDDLDVVMKADLTVGKTWQGHWDAATAYSVDDMVCLDGIAYLCISGNTNQTPPNGTYWTAQASNEIAVLVATVYAHNGTVDISPEYAIDDEKRLRVQLEPPKVGEDLVVVTHNWGDRCTWFEKSVQVTGETLTDSGDGLTFNSTKKRWIDLTHGRMSFENRYAADYPHEVRINGTPATERAPFATTGGDYEIDYTNGDVTFFSSQSGNTITADYYHNDPDEGQADASLFIIEPDAGKRLWLSRSEVQFSADCDILDTINFQGWAYNPYDLPNKVAATTLTQYKRAHDFINEATGVYPVTAAFGGATRGLTQAHYTFPFNYNKVKELRASLGVEIRVWLSNHKEFGGEFATATFYGKSLTE